jgi:NTP pyrophosphatase (non-canonical NTP hydrolase)
MEEILQLKEYLIGARYDDALMLVGEMEEMAREDKINKVHSYCVVLLIHLIKRHAEGHTTRSWDASIYNSLKTIARTNKRKNSGGYYLDVEGLQEELADALDEALQVASLEAFSGSFTPSELLEKFDQKAVLHEALTMILDKQATMR